MKKVKRWGTAVEIEIGCTQCRFEESTIKKVEEKKLEKIQFLNGKRSLGA